MMACILPSRPRDRCKPERLSGQFQPSGRRLPSATAPSVALPPASTQSCRARQVSMSMLNTRFKRCAQVFDARLFAGVLSRPSSDALGLAPIPNFAGVTRARCLLLGANTPDKCIGNGFGRLRLAREAASIRNDTRKTRQIDPELRDQRSCFRVPSQPQRSHPSRNIQAKN